MKTIRNSGTQGFVSMQAGIVIALIIVGIFVLAYEWRGAHTGKDHGKSGGSDHHHKKKHEEKSAAPK